MEGGADKGVEGSTQGKIGGEIEDGANSSIKGGIWCGVEDGVKDDRKRGGHTTGLPSTHLPGL